MRANVFREEAVADHKVDNIEMHCKTILEEYQAIFNHLQE